MRYEQGWRRDEEEFLRCSARPAGRLSRSSILLVFMLYMALVFVILSLQIFTTKDSLRVGVKLLVAYRIADPRRAITALSKDGIAKHVENCSVVSARGDGDWGMIEQSAMQGSVVVAMGGPRKHGTQNVSVCVFASVQVDMGKSIQASSSKDFLSSAQNKPLSSPGEAPSLLQHFQDTVKSVVRGKRAHEQHVDAAHMRKEWFGSSHDRATCGFFFFFLCLALPVPSPLFSLRSFSVFRQALASDLEEYGIELVRLNFETPKVLDKDIARQMVRR
jgi:hypothetical protein